MTLKAQMDRIYREMKPDDIPWNVTEPPLILQDLLVSGWVEPCNTVDLGCGAGNFAVWFAHRDFKMTGFDLSSSAIQLAEQAALEQKVSCRFEVQDLICEVRGFDNQFEFAYDWEVLHHVFPDDRQNYVKNVYRMLREGGRYFSLCFSEDEPSTFGGSGKFRTTPLGTTLYFSSEQELRQLFEPYFEIECLDTVQVPGKRGMHMAVKALMSKRIG